MWTTTSIHAFCPGITVNCKKKKKEKKQFKSAWRPVPVITRHHQQQSSQLNHLHDRENMRRVMLYHVSKSNGNKHNDASISEILLQIMQVK